MNGSFQRIALLQTHQQLAPVHVYYLNDLVELCGLASAVRDRVSDVDLPVSPSDRCVSRLEGKSVLAVCC